MDSLGPQLDSAIEAALRMLEGNTGASRWDKQTREQRQNKCKSNQDKYHWISKTDRQRMLEGNTGRTNNKEKDDNKYIIRKNAIRILCWHDYLNIYEVSFRSESHESSGESKVVAEEVDDQEEIIEVSVIVRFLLRKRSLKSSFLILWTFSIQNITIQ